MKFLVMLFVLIFGQITCAQGLIFSSVKELPKVLELRQRTSWDNKIEVYHDATEFGAQVNVGFMKTQSVQDFKRFFLESGKNFSCSGDFEFRYDSHNMQFIAVKSIDVCVDEQGFVVAHSINRPTLSSTEIQSKAQEIEKNRAAVQEQIKVNQSDLLKQPDPAPRDSTRVELPPVTISY